MKVQKANFKFFGEKKRGYGDGEINDFNIKRTPHKIFFTHFSGEPILYQDHQKLATKINVSPLHRMFWINETEFISHELLQFKRVFADGNFRIVHNKIVCVGNKRPTTNLPAGLLFEWRRKQIG